MLIAVSDDSDPNGVWHKYRIEAKAVHPIYEDQRGKRLAKGSNQILCSQGNLADSGEGLQEFPKPRELLSGRRE